MRLAAAETTIAALTRARDAAVVARDAAPTSVATDIAIDSLARSVGQQLSAVQRGLVDHPVRLAQVSVTLRGVAVPAGDRVATRFGEAGPASEPTLGFVATRPAGAVMPDLRGYTEPLARRKLEELGLDVAATVGPGASGVVVSQTPEAGTPVEPGVRAELTLGR